MRPGGVIVEGLVKRFGQLTALDTLDFVAPEGTVAALLGPNGAGKTTTIRILATLLRPDGGQATVGGHDVIRHPNRVRAVIGLTGQYAAIDEDMTGRENLVLVGRLSRLSKTRAVQRANEMLGVFSLTAAADRLLRTYSGGMRRRLDIAASLMVSPPVLFLDEPTVGLDPRSRRELWDLIAERRDQGTTVVLTTQYLEEADRLSQTISVVDRGRVVAQGTADELKTKVGGDVLDLTVADRGQLDTAVETLTRRFSVPAHDLRVDRAGGRVQLPVLAQSRPLTAALRALDAEDVVVADLALRRPTLDDVFLKLTGRTA